MHEEKEFNVNTEMKKKCFYFSINMIVARMKKIMNSLKNNFVFEEKKKEMIVLTRSTKK
jgi:hypothetical protein